MHDAFASQAGIQHMGHHLHARHQARLLADGGGKHVAQARGRCAHQHVLAVQRPGRQLAAQHIDVRVGGEGRWPGGVGDERRVIALPGAGIRCAGRRGRAGGHRLPVCHALQRGAEVVPGGGRRAFLQVQAAHHAIAVGRHMHMAQAGGSIGKGGPGQVGLVADGAIAAPQHGQHHARTAPDGVGEQQVVLGVVQVGFVEQHVHADGTRVLGGQARDQLGMQGPAPGPAADGGDAGVVDGHDHDVGVGGP